MTGSRPELVRGGLRGWPPTAHLDLATLARRYGDRIVRVHRSPLSWSPIGQFDRAPGDRIRQPVRGITPSSEMSVVSMPLRAAIAGVLGDFRVLEPATYAVAAVSLSATIPDVGDHLELPGPVRPLGPVTPYLWLGPQGKTVPLHVDGVTGMLGQVVGRKRLHLLPPDAPGVYPTGRNPHLSRITDVRSVDRHEFPEFEAGAIQVHVLEPGDLMYVPQGWWHQVDYLDAAVSVNFWPPEYLAG